MDLALNKLQRLICHKPKQPTNIKYTRRLKKQKTTTTEDKNNNNVLCIICKFYLFCPLVKMM